MATRATMTEVATGAFRKHAAVPYYIAPQSHAFSLASASVHCAHRLVLVSECVCTCEFARVRIASPHSHWRE